MNLLRPIRVGVLCLMVIACCYPVLAQQARNPLLEMIGKGEGIYRDEYEALCDSLFSGDSLSRAELVRLFTEAAAADPTGEWKLDCRRISGHVRFWESRKGGFIPSADYTAEMFALELLGIAHEAGTKGFQTLRLRAMFNAAAVYRIFAQEYVQAFACYMEAKDKAPRLADVVTLKGRWLTTSLNLATDVVGSTGTATDVKMHYRAADKCWYAPVSEQVVTTGSVQLTFEWTHTLTLKHPPPTQFTLAKGEVKPLDITIDVNMAIDPNHVYKVGDAYPHVGFSDKKGVVFDVSPDGRSGKIFNLQRWPNMYGQQRLYNSVQTIAIMDG